MCWWWSRYIKYLVKPVGLLQDKTFEWSDENLLHFYEIVRGMNAGFRISVDICISEYIGSGLCIGTGGESCK